MKRVLVRLCCIFVGAALELVLVEVALRSLAAHPRDDALARARSDLTRWFDVMHAGLYETHDDERLLFSLAPRIDVTVDGVRYRTNEHALRGPSTPREKPAGTRRIALLGDSYAFGLGVAEEETIGAWIERDLRGRGASVEVLNLGTPAHHTGQETAWLERTGFAFDLDAVVLLFYDNDAIYHALRWDAGRRFLYNDELPVPAWLRAAFGDWALYGWISRIHTRSLAARGLLTSGPRFWPVTRLRLERLAAACRERGVPLVVANLPFVYWTTYLADPVQFAPHAELYERVAAFARDAGLPWIDLLARIAPGPRHFARQGFVPVPVGPAAAVAQLLTATRLAWLQAHAWCPVEFLMIAPRTEGFDNHFNASGCRLVGEAIAASLAPRFAGE